MKSSRRRTVLWLGGGLLFAYLAVVGFMAVSEPRLVYPGSVGRGGAHAFPEAGSLAWDTLRVAAPDSVPVLLLLARLPNPDSHPWILFFHGNGGLLGSGGSVARYRLFQEAGFNVAAAEYRGYGASSGFGPPSEAGLYDDAMGAWSYLTRDLRIPRERIAVFGWSLGSGPATYVAAHGHPATLLTEGAFTSLPDVAATMYPWLPVHLIMRNRFDNLRRVGDLQVPWIVFHGRRDGEVPFSEGQALAAADPSARLVPLDAGHEDGITKDTAVALGALRSIAHHLVPLDSSGERAALKPR